MTDPWRRLAAGIILQAIQDANGKAPMLEPGDEEEAQDWLRSPEAAALAAALDLDLLLADWLRHGARMPAGRLHRGKGDHKATPAPYGRQQGRKRTDPVSIAA